MNQSKALKAILFFSILAAIAWGASHGYKNLMTEMASVKTEMASVKTEVAYFGSRHVSLRQRFILDQISQQTTVNWGLIVGDSIVEGMNTAGFSIPIINGGIGGARLFDIAEMISLAQVSQKARFVIVSAGVNNTVRKNEAISIEGLSKNIDDLLLAAKKISDSVFLSTVFPIEKGKPLGDQYFDQEKIDTLNSLLREKAKEHNVTLIKLDEAFEGYSQSYTTDGVHPNGAGYDILRSTIISALSKAR